MSFKIQSAKADIWRRNAETGICASRSAISGVDPGLVDGAYLQLSDAIKFLPAVLAVCTVFALTVTALTRQATRVFHEGGDVFADVGDKDYRTILNWATETIERTPEVLEFGEASEGLR